MKNLQYYLELPYTTIIRRDEEGDYIARIDEIPGCAAHGKNPEQALEALEEAKQLWITDCLESGDPVPEPATEEALPSGKWVQRVPRSLHKKLVTLAKRESVSLNQLVASILAEAVGARRVDQPDHTADDLLAAGLVSWGYWPISPEKKLDKINHARPRTIKEHEASYRKLAGGLGSRSRKIPGWMITRGRELSHGHKEPVKR